MLCPSPARGAAFKQNLPAFGSYIHFQKRLLLPLPAGPPCQRFIGQRDSSVSWQLLLKITSDKLSLRLRNQPTPFIVRFCFVGLQSFNNWRFCCDAVQLAV